MSDGSIAYRDRPYDPPVGDRGPNPNGGGQVKRKRSKYPPQENVKRFWDKFNTKYPGKVFTILPDDPHARIKAAKAPKGAVQQRAARSYEEARAQCERNVHRIIKECRRVNQKYRDPHFDIEWDLKSGRRNCLDGLAKGLQGGSPKGVKRVTVSRAEVTCRNYGADVFGRMFLRNLNSTSTGRLRVMYVKAETVIAISWPLSAALATWKGSLAKSASLVMKKLVCMALSSTEVGVRFSTEPISQSFWRSVWKWAFGSTTDVSALPVSSTDTSKMANGNNVLWTTSSI